MKKLFTIIAIVMTLPAVAQKKLPTGKGTPVLGKLTVTPIYRDTFYFWQQTDTTQGNVKYSVDSYGTVEGPGFIVHTTTCSSSGKYVANQRQIDSVWRVNHPEDSGIRMFTSYGWSCSPIETTVCFIRTDTGPKRLPSGAKYTLTPYINSGNKFNGL